MPVRAFEVRAGSAISFAARADRTVLQEAASQGITLPSGCRSGGCGACRAKVLCGEFVLGPDALALTQEDRAQGFALLCQTYARSNLEIEVGESLAAANRVVRLHEVAFPSPDVAKLRLDVEGQPLLYRAGQHVDLALKDGTRRTYSIANPCADGKHLELHIRIVPQGRFTSRLAGASPAIRPGVRMRMAPPRGDFHLRESARPVVMVATGTGYAPIRAMLLQMLSSGSRRDVSLYWGAKTAADLYDTEEAKELLGKLGGRYVPVISSPVHNAVLGDFSTLSDCDVYVCGSPAMVRAAHSDFIAAGRLERTNFFADAFGAAPLCIEAIDEHI
jgi:CDP-4-dehydro-6-deoxyglucose reductase